MATWAALEEQPFLDSDAGGQWICGATQGWGAPFPSDSVTARQCTSCPPCIRKGHQCGIMCTTSENNGYANAWPYQFAAGSGRPMGPEVPLFQELYHVRRYLPMDVPIQTPYLPALL